MIKSIRPGDAKVSARTALTLCRGAWRLRAGRLPWRSRRSTRRR